MPQARPNMLILMPDQMRADCMSAVGHPQIKTPNMDRLCAEGTRLENAVTSCPLCMPARASFVNGLYSHNHFMWMNRGRMPAEDETFFQILQRAGYYTGHIGKSHYYDHAGQHMRDEEPYMHARGLDYVHEITGPWATTKTRSYMTDEWEKHGLYDKFKDDYRKRKENGPCSVWPSPLPTELHLDSYVGRIAEEFVKGYDRDEPFCLFVGFGGPHEPWDAPGEYAEMYSPAEAPAAIAASDPQEWLPEHAVERMTGGRVERMTAEDIGRLRANYYGKISLIDYWFGRIISACEEQGFWDDTLVVFWSDHGEMLGDQGRLHKNVFYESSIRVPLVLRWPGRIPEGETTRALAQQIDVFPTLVDAVDAPPSTRCQGKSLWPVISGKAESVRDAVLSEHAKGGREERNYMVRTERFKYAMDRLGRGYMLFDLEKDSGEQVNLIGHPDMKDVQAGMHQRLFELLADAQPCMRTGG